MLENEGNMSEEMIDQLEMENHFRYERKFVVPDTVSIPHVRNIINSNDALFREIYHLRQVNNIYFDTFDYGDYKDNVLGVSDRKKIRIRWYGDTFGKIGSPVLEFKIKKGVVGDKWSFPLKEFTLDNTFNMKIIEEVFDKSDLPGSIREQLKGIIPTLLNSYHRTYHLSADKKFRITIDYGIKYHKIDSHFNHFGRLESTDENNVVELKYGLEDDRRANQISTQFPFRLHKNSKYVNGVNMFASFAQ